MANAPRSGTPSAVSQPKVGGKTIQNRAGAIPGAVRDQARTGVDFNVLQQLMEADSLKELGDGRSGFEAGLPGSGAGADRFSPGVLTGGSNNGPSVGGGAGGGTA